MSKVKAKIAPVAWPLLAASAILAATSVLRPGLIPTWLVLVPLVLVVVECVLTMPAQVLLAYSGVKGLEAMYRYLRSVTTRTAILDLIAEEVAKQDARAEQRPKTQGGEQE